MYGIPTINAQSPSFKPSVAPPTKSSICLYGGFCDDNIACIAGTTCVQQSPYYSQCLPDFTNENSVFATKNSCSLMYGNCGTTKKCCNSAFTCSTTELKCVPIEPPQCSNPTNFNPTSAPSIAPTAAPSSAPTISDHCDTSKVNLLNFEAWRREGGLWVGDIYSSSKDIKLKINTFSDWRVFFLRSQWGSIYICRMAVSIPTVRRFHLHQYHWESSASKKYFRISPTRSPKVL